MSSASSITRNNGITEGFHNKMELVIAKPTASATSKTADSAPRYYMIDSLDGVLPGMGSNHELDRILKSHNLLILQSHRSRQKHQNQGSGTKSVQNLFSRR